MGPCEGMRGWRRRDGAGAFRVGVGVLLLGLSLAQSTPPQAPCPAGVAPQSLTQPQYQDNTGVDAGTGFMADLVQSFLHTVQPNPFPKDLILKFAKDFDQVQSDPDVIKEVLHYQIGFLVCAAIGVLYIVLMPIVGFFLACCRCCGNCGGKMYQEQTSGIHCCRRALYWSAFITTLIILAGNICMFRSNEALRVSVDQSAVELNNTLDNLQTYLAAVPQQFDRVVNESYKTTHEVSQNLNAIGPQLGAEIQKGFKGTLDPALSSVRVMDQETTSTNDLLRELNSSLVWLQSSVNLLQANVSAVKNRINQTIHKPSCTGCMALQPDLQKLTVDISVTIPSLGEFQSAVDEVIKADLKSQIKEVEDYFNSIPQRVTNDTKDVVQSTKQQLEEIQAQISQLTKDIPLSALTNVSDTLGQLQAEISSVTPEVERAEHIRWAVCVTLCCVVLLVVVCNVLGLLLGPLGLTPKADPTERSCTADCGGTFLIMGAGFSFLISWLFMLVVLLLFLLGGNVYTLVCQPWDNGELLKFIDTPGLIPQFELGPMLGLKSNLTLTNIYSDCEKNMPLWSTLHLYELVDLEDLLNVSKYTEEIQQHFENTNITLSTITFLSPEVQQLLSSFSAEAKDVDFTTVTQQINNISSINLNTTADKLDELANVQTNSEIQTELRGEAMELRQIQINIDTTIIPQLEKLNSTIESLRSIAGKINGTVGEVLSKAGAAQDFLNTNTTQIVKTESREFLDCQIAYFIAYADWANITITQQLGRCGPVAGAVDSAEIIICSHMVESLNAFWFSLGWCMIFFIPSIIFSIKLAKYYRRMEQSDVFENHIMMNHIPRAQMRAY
ncbi:prominin-2 [Centroberyx affinis]|uniref:prominin-2 n=1 Tax=Centroberyx affinis TaxID=166261 RepID=UPI003A5B9E26